MAMRRHVFKACAPVWTESACSPEHEAGDVDVLLRRSPADWPRRAEAALQRWRRDSSDQRSRGSASRASRHVPLGAPRRSAGRSGLPKSAHAPLLRNGSEDTVDATNTVFLRRWPVDGCAASAGEAACAQLTSCTAAHFSDDNQVAFHNKVLPCPDNQRRHAADKIWRRLLLNQQQRRQQFVWQHGVVAWLLCWRKRISRHVRV